RLARCPFASVNQTVGRASTAQCPACQPKDGAGFGLTRAGGGRFINEGNGHLFHLQRNQSSVPQMAWAFFDKVSSAAASASAFSFLRSSFSNARLFLRSAAKAD